MKVLLIFFYMFLTPIIGISGETELLCLIDEELENNLPAKKKIFTGKEIKFYLDKENKWLYEVKKRNGIY